MQVRAVTACQGLAQFEIYFHPSRSLNTYRVGSKQSTKKSGMFKSRRRSISYFYSSVTTETWLILEEVPDTGEASWLRRFIVTSNILFSSWRTTRSKYRVSCMWAQAERWRESVRRHIAPTDLCKILIIRAHVIFFTRMRACEAHLWTCVELRQVFCTYVNLLPLNQHIVSRIPLQKRRFLTGEPSVPDLVGKTCSNETNLCHLSGFTISTFPRTTFSFGD